MLKKGDLAVERLCKTRHHNVCFDAIGCHFGIPDYEKVPLEMVSDAKEDGTGDQMMIEAS